MCMINDTVRKYEIYTFVLQINEFKHNNINADKQYKLHSNSTQTNNKNKIINIDKYKRTVTVRHNRSTALVINNFLSFLI